MRSEIDRLAPIQRSGEELRSYHAKQAQVHEKEAKRLEKVLRAYAGSPKSGPEHGESPPNIHEFQVLHIQEAKAHSELAQMPLKKLEALYANRS